MITPDAAVLAALVVAVLIPLLLPFAAAPVRMRRTSWHPAESTYAPDDEAVLPQEARDVTADLREMGFEGRGTWRHLGTPLATARVVLLEHPRALDAAKVIVVAAGTRRSVTLAFHTRFADGSAVITANSRVVAGLPIPPGVTTAWLPEVRNPSVLYRVHAELRDAVGGGTRRVGVGPDTAGLLAAEAEETHDAWVAAGYYRRDEYGERLLPTWKGAVLVTWRLLWPVKPLFRARRRRATRELLARHGVTLEG